MLTKESAFSPAFAPCLPEGAQKEEVLYFDIETTGLSAASAYVYLIGCAFFENGGYRLLQWLCEEPSEEKELLSLFLKKAQSYSYLAHYNGTGFDLPFLTAKCGRHHLSCPFDKLLSLDYYKLLLPYKKLFSTENMKLTTMTSFLGVSRTDPFSGADLTVLYTTYVGKRKIAALTGRSEEADALEQVLLLHNKEDITILPSISSLLFLPDLAAQTDAALISVQEQTLSVTLPTAVQKTACCTLKKEVSDLNAVPATFLFTVAKDCIRLFIPLLSGELKYFYPDYKDYFYLPLEDTAIHKSVAAYVEKEYRKKATPATCYKKQQGTFFPVPPLFSTTLPRFFPAYKAKLPYLLLTEELLLDAAFWTAYGKEFVSFFFS